MFAGMVLLLVRNKNFDSDYSNLIKAFRLKVDDAALRKSNGKILVRLLEIGAPFNNDFVSNTAQKMKFSIF